MKMRRIYFLLGAICLLVSILATGCDTTADSSGQITPKATASERIAAPTATTPPVPTPSPEVDMTHAHQAFDSGGELTYDEVLALKLEIVGNFPFIVGRDSNYEDQVAYHKREQDFSAKLIKCTLKATYGWVAGGYYDIDEHQNEIPGKERLGIYMADPFHGAGKDATWDPDLFLIGLTYDQIPHYKLGQLVKFSGNPTIIHSGNFDGEPDQWHDEWSVKNATYTMLHDVSPIPTPTAEQLEDLHITLERTGCFGRCPSYILTINPDSKVIFVGRSNTAITGTVTSNIEQDKLIELATEISKADFFNMKDDYVTVEDDVAKYTLTVQMGGQHKQVISTIYPPRRLSILMWRIDEIVDSDQWIDGNN